MASQGETESDKDIFVELLECYKRYRCLWDISCPQYSNREVRNEAYIILLQIFKKTQRNATMDMLKKKIENLRTSYKRELKKVKESTGTDGGIQEIYVPRLWYFDHLTFLDEKDNLNGICTLTGTEEDGNKSEEEQKFEQPKAKKKRYISERNQDELIDATCASLSTKNDDWKVIGKSIGLQLKDLTAHQQAIAQKLISDAIFYGKMKKLTEQSHIELSPLIPELSPSATFDQ